MLHKNFPFEFKTLDDSGTFEATVAIFNNVDHGGDRIIPGAFAKTLAMWEASGDPIPVIFNHDWATPDAHIGVVEKAVETSQGLLVKGRLDVADNPVAKQVHRLMQRRSLKEFSFGYSVPAGGEKRAKDGANDLLQIDLAEVGPTLKGMNPATELHSVKSALGVEDAPLDAKALADEAARVAREVEATQIPALPLQKRLASDVREQLDAAGGERFGRSQDKWVYVDDYDPDGKWAVFAVSSNTQSRFVQIDYTLDSDGSITLGSTETEVMRTTSYRAVNGSKTYGNSELQEVKSQLSEVLETVKKKADEADKEPKKARSVDPLRKQADAVALEIASDGQSLRKPPKTAAPPAPPDLIPLDELRRRMREEMLGVLSGGMTE